MILDLSKGNMSMILIIKMNIAYSHIKRNENINYKLAVYTYIKKLKCYINKLFSKIS